MAENHSQNHEPEDVGYEKSDVNIGKIFFFSFLGIAVIVISLVLVVDLFDITSEEQIEDAVLKPQSAAIRELRARETEELTTYAVIDAKKGVYRIPIERAIELMADEAYQARLKKQKSR